MKNLLFFLLITLASALLIVDIVSNNPVQAQTIPQNIQVKPAIARDIIVDRFSFASGANKFAKEYTSKGYDVTISAAYADIIVIAKKY